ncbi:ECF transporter S component [Weissella minor]|uniref:ECF transporter S component n=1 Tax=Weissella minor TaxID=1620 RepID=UPI001BAFD544|nr:ECF transporter S component [Weissella minor]MBS0949553.1 ECF transporter S component [Weissella minor]
MVRNSKAFRLSILALFIAFVIIQNFVPFLGYIPVGALSLTTIQITVIVAAIVLGPTDGAIVGGVWGILSCIKAFTSPSSPVASLIFTNPLISVLPRILVGLLAGYLFIWFTKTKIKEPMSATIVGGLGALLNTVLVLGLIFIFYRNPAVAQAYGVSNPNLIGGVLMATVGTNGIPEAILSAIGTPIISIPLLHFMDKSE